VTEVGDNRRWIDEILDDIPVPVVFLTLQPHSGISTVAVDNYAGGTLVTQHLLDQGHRKIGHISGPLDWWEARLRKPAWLDTLAKDGIETTEDHWVEGNWSSASEAVAFEQLLQSYPGMDAVFVANDQMTLTVHQRARRRNLRIPGDLAVAGFDNITESEYFWPPLTTIHHNHHELGCRAIQELVSRIEAIHRNEKIEAKNRSLSVQLIVRESSVVK
jgi:DNA-binding LacI/PurR family transcriptional regulator